MNSGSVRVSQMSVKLNGIDLNSVVDSFEANDEAGHDNRLEKEDFIKNYGDQGDVAGVSVDVARVLREGNGTWNFGGSVNEILNGEMEAVDGNDEGLDSERMSLNIESELKENNLENEECINGDEIQKYDGNLCLELKREGNGEVAAVTDRGQNQERGFNVLPPNALAEEKVGLMVDLNVSHDSNCDIRSDNVNNGTGIYDCSIESNLPVSVGLIESTETITEAVENGNENMLIKVEVINESPEDLDGEDVKHCALMPKVRGKENQTEREGEYYLSDLVWGKVRSHPWWPGQIFEPSAASKKAIEHMKKDSYLIAYFGDQTFAWSEASKIKPFRMYFSQMEKQSKGENFNHAVDVALNEVSRRIQFGLACRCLTEEVLASVNSQVVVSAGIQEKSCRIWGTDSFSTAGSFFPENLVNYLKLLAEAPNAAIDRLEFARVRAQFLAFNRWKGYLQLPVFEDFDSNLENDVDHSGLQTTTMEQGVLGCNDNNQALSGKTKSPAQSSSQKRTHMTTDYQRKKKKKHIMELVHGGSPSLPNGEKKSEGKASRKLPCGPSRLKRKVDNVILNESSVKRRKEFLSEQARSETSSLPRKCFEAGELVFGVAGKPGGSTESASVDIEAVEHGGKSLHVSGCGVSAMSKGKSLKAGLALREFPPTDEMLSKLVYAARNPIEAYSLLISVAGFFSDFRNSICMECNNIQWKKKPLGKQKAENSCELDGMGTFKFEGMEDSYWTDRIIESRQDERVLFEPETHAEDDVFISEPERVCRMNSNRISDQEMNTMVAELDVEYLSQTTNDNSNEISPTVLILNFTSLESVPSITSLNEIFSRYGPLNESETEVLSKSKRAKVVFKRRCDAETAFSSTGKFSIFGPSLLSYRLKYSPATRKSSTASKSKGRRKKSTLAQEDAK